MSPVPVTVITGFLGAGKTTLLDAWLRAHTPSEVAVIINEVASQGIDGELLRGRAEQLVEITAGCICCTTNQELLHALETLAASTPKRIFIETSGAASPAGVVRAALHVEGILLDGIVTVVDASGRAPLPPLLVDLAQEQLAYADVVVLSQVDRAEPEAVRKATQAVLAVNPTAVQVEAIRGVVRGHTFASLLAQRAESLTPPPRENASHGAVETLVLTAPGELDPDAFADWVERDLGAFESRLFRVKGIVAVAGLPDRLVVQGVAGRLEASLGLPWGPAARTSRLVVIGYGLDPLCLREGFARTRAVT